MPSMRNILCAVRNQGKFKLIIIKFHLEMEKSNFSGMRQFQRDQKLAQRYIFLQEVAAGNLTHVFKVICKRDQSIIALKTQSTSPSPPKLTLQQEFQMLTRLQGALGVPQVYEFGQWTGGCFLEMQFCPERLQDKTFSLGEITDVALYTLRILEGLHAAGIIFQDMQPSSLMLSQDGRICLVGFGRTKVMTGRKHPETVSPFNGNYRFASVRAHGRLELSRKDDLEALFYSLAFLYYRRLPWSRIGNHIDHTLIKIKQLKISSRDTLFTEMGAPFMRGFEYVTKMQVYGEPDYALLKSHFKRRKSVMVEHRKEEKMKSKKISLNYSNFSQLLGEELEEQLYEDVASFTFGKILEQKQMKKALSSKHCSLHVDPNDQNISADDSSEPTIAVLSHTFNLKNPFHG